MNEIDIYELGKHGWKCAVKLGDIEYVLPLQDWHDLAHNIIAKTEPHLTNAMHSDGDKSCLCPGGIGICGLGDPDTNICNHPRR